MNQERAWTLLEGRQGAEGYISRLGEEAEITCTGLGPGERTALYRFGPGGASLCLEQAADAGGALRCRLPGGGEFFLARAGQVLLWEGKGGREESFLFACASLARMEKGAAAGASSSPLRARHRRRPLRKIPENAPEIKTAPEEMPLPAWFDAAKAQREKQREKRNREVRLGRPVGGLPQRK